MGASSRVLLFAAASACTLAACDVLLGIDQYKDVACAFDCGVGPADVAPHPDVHETGAETAPDVLSTAPETGPETGTDATDGGDAADVVGDTTLFSADALPVPTGHETWAYWPMPNPDAAIGPWDGAPALPHAMAYEAGADGGGVYDEVTKLVWSVLTIPASSLVNAWTMCKGFGPGWRVPTRIELVSLIDFTAPLGQPTISVAFPDTPLGYYWTSSAVPGVDGGSIGVWTVSFMTGLTDNSGVPASWVRCVYGAQP
jgi:hypothetical protein